MKNFREWLLLREKANEEAWELIQKGNVATVELEAEPVKKFYQSLVKSISKTPQEERGFYYGGASTGGEEHWQTSTNIEQNSPLNQLAIKITQYIDHLPTMPLSKLGVSILQLKDMGNKQELARLSPRDGRPVGFHQFMDVIGGARRKEKRDISYLRSLETSTDPSVLLRLGGEYYVIGGRTRLMSSYATGRDAPVKVMDAGQLQQFLARSFMQQQPLS